MQIKESAQKTVSISLYPLLGLFAIFVPIILWWLNTSLIDSTYEKYEQLFELFGFCASVALIVFAYVELKKRYGQPFNNLLPVILPILVCFNYLSIISEYSGYTYKIYDYQCYEVAAKAVLAGITPYVNLGHIYTYPPLTAQILAWLYQLIDLNITIIHLSVQSSEQIWGLVFYFYQCTQLLLIGLAYFLGYRFAKNIGLESVPASFLLAAILLFNNPLLRTLRHGQINLWLLDIFLLAVLLLQHYPLISGFLIAVGGHIKLYPLILIMPWGIAKQWLAVWGTIASFFTILLIQTNGGTNWNLWGQFLGFFGLGSSNSLAIAAPYVPDSFRNNSLHSVIFNFSKGIGKIVDISAGFANVVFLSATLAVVVWFGFRFIRREQAYYALAKTAEIPTSDRGENTFRLYGHSVDALSLGLLISPSVWEHHYVLAIPIAVWAIATRGHEKPWQVGISTFLMFCLPTFDVFPFSYHRILGLLVLLYIASPHNTPERIGRVPLRRQVTSGV
jgi:hypothetical protein